MAIGTSIGARLEHLSARKGVPDAELAKVFGINRSTMGRILKGETEKVSSQMIIDAAQYFRVSTDFLLGLTDMPDPMNHPVESFGLTEGAARAILSEDVNINMLNRLLENLRFCQLTQTIFRLRPRAQSHGAGIEDSASSSRCCLLMPSLGASTMTLLMLSLLFNRLARLK